MQLDSVLDCATRAHVPVLIWGPPGVGKSAAIQAWAKKRSLRCWTVIASLREPADFGGLPVISQAKSLDGKTEVSVTFAPPRFATEANLEGGVIFLDELTTAPPAVQAALLRAVVDKAFGDLEMDPEQVTLVAAANPPSEAAGGWDLAPPLANRFTHQTFALEASAWIAEFPGYWQSPPNLQFHRQRVAPQDWAQARSLIAGFIRARPTLLLQVPQDESKKGQAWPSPRTWDFASRLLASLGAGRGNFADIAGDGLPLIGGCIGDGAALEFATWLREFDLPNPEDLLARPHEYRHPKRGDQAYAILSSVGQAALGKLTPERWDAAWKILSRAADAGGVDVAASAAKNLAQAWLPRRDELPLPTAQLQPFLPMLRAAGYM